MTTTNARSYTTLETRVKENLVKPESKTEKELVQGLKDADEVTQIQMLVNLCKIGRWDLLGCGLKAEIQEKVFEECRKQGINTDQIK